MNNIIPFVDLKQQYKLHQEVFEEAMREVCLASSYILGSELERFECRFADYIGVKESVGVASGTDSLRLACQVLGIGHKDEVLIPANTFIASALAVSDLGATVVPVDVDPETFLVDIDDAERKVTSRTKAIIPVHLYGQSVDMDAVAAFAADHNLIIIEDACQSHGAMWNGRHTGSFGAIGCFSFYPAKNLGAFGDGGLITTNDQCIAEKLKLLRNYGSVKKYIHEVPGTNSRLDSIQAVILNIKMDFLDDWNRKRFRAALRYADGLKNIESVKVPVFDRNDSTRHIFHLFVIQCECREELMTYLNDHGVQCGIHYPVPVHLHRASKSLNIRIGKLSVVEMLSDKILSLPMFPEITDEQIDAVVNAIKRFYDKQ